MGSELNIVASHINADFMRMKINIAIIIFLNLVLLAGFQLYWSTPHSSEYQKLDELKAEYSKPAKKVVDHSRFEILQQEFKSGAEVSAACASCHQERHEEVMQSNHWNWEREEYIEGKGVTYLGKKNIINNFCIGATSNEQACAKCHIGFGYEKENSFFANESNVDCLSCHTQSEDYVKDGGWGNPNAQLDLSKAAQQVAMPEKVNCGTCHFFSGGGNNVKHGDLEYALLDCSRETDVHMASNGIDLNCTDCHTTENHNIKGKLYSISSENTNRASCEDCHSSMAHEDATLNAHGNKVACQTCHIPEYAKENATKMTWDWSTAGKLKDGEPFHLEDEDHNHTYLSIKGSFTWEKNVKPEYTWFNGTADHYILGDKTDTLKPIAINTLNGSYHDGKIIPVKVHRAKQPYDPVNQLLIQPHTVNPEKGSGAYWTDFDWEKASAIGQEKMGLPFSGEVAFANTEMSWPINHMVAPADKALSCTECHTDAPEGRLSQLSGFYMPGRDGHGDLDKIGKLLLLLALSGVALHTLGRIIFKS